jgi:hypothetical protein
MHPDGTNRFLLYFHNWCPRRISSPALPTRTTDVPGEPRLPGVLRGPGALPRRTRSPPTPRAQTQGRALLERLFAKSFVDRIDSAQLTFADTGTMTFESDDGKCTTTLTGTARPRSSLADAGSYLYDLYGVAPAMTSEAGVDFTPYFPAEQALYFASQRDAFDFYEKGPSITEKGDVTHRMAQILQDDFFNEVDAVARATSRTPRSCASRTPRSSSRSRRRWSFPAHRGSCRARRCTTTATTPGAATWSRRWPPTCNGTCYRNAAGTILVRMLYNEKESDFKAACDAAKIAPASRYYDYQKAQGLLRPHRRELEARV